MTFKQARKELNLTQAAIAPLIGSSLRSVKYWEAGVREPCKSAKILLDGLIERHRQGSK